MQPIVIERPYRFVPPHRGTWWPSFIRFFDLQGIWLRRAEGVVAHECRGTEHLRRSFEAGHGILLAPNHCRNADPVVMGWLSREVGFHLYAMASWHLFQSRFQRFAIRRMGGFSVHREGVDKQAIETAIEILETAERPLVIFPEGTVSRTNDQLHTLLEGVSFIAHTAARRRARNVPGGQVVVHPVGLKYRFGGDLKKVADEVLSDLEHRLSWPPQRHRSVLERIGQVESAWQYLKELQYFGGIRQGSLGERRNDLIERLLTPLEQEWLGAPQAGAAVPRAKNLQTKIMPDLARGQVDETERLRRRSQLTDIELARQLSFHPEDYLSSRPSVDRILETLERLEEAFEDQARVHGSLTVIIQIAPPIPVNPARERRSAVDPLMETLADSLRGMLAALALESPLGE